MSSRSRLPIYEKIERERNNNRAGKYAASMNPRHTSATAPFDERSADGPQMRNNGYRDSREDYREFRPSIKNRYPEKPRRSFNPKSKTSNLSAKNSYVHSNSQPISRDEQNYKQQYIKSNYIRNNQSNYTGNITDEYIRNLKQSESEKYRNPRELNDYTTGGQYEDLDMTPIYSPPQKEYLIRAGHPTNTIEPLDDIKHNYSEANEQFQSGREPPYKLYCSKSNSSVKMRASEGRDSRVVGRSESNDIEFLSNKFCAMNAAPEWGTQLLDTSSKVIEDVFIDTKAKVMSKQNIEYGAMVAGVASKTVLTIGEQVHYAVEGTIKAINDIQQNYEQNQNARKEYREREIERGRDQINQREYNYNHNHGYDHDDQRRENVQQVRRRQSQVPSVQIDKTVRTSGRSRRRSRSFGEQSSTTSTKSTARSDRSEKRSNKCESNSRVKENSSIQEKKSIRFRDTPRSRSYIGSAKTTKYYEKELDYQQTQNKYYMKKKNGMKPFMG